MNNEEIFNNKNKINEIINDLIKYVNRNNYYIAGRIKTKYIISTSITNGDFNSFINLKESGIGFHIFDYDGYSIFISSYNFDIKNLNEKIDSGINILKNYKKFYNESNKNIFELQPVKAKLIKNPEINFENINSQDFQKKFNNFYNNIKKENNLSYTIGTSLKYQENYIFRSDGTEIFYNEFYSLITGDISTSTKNKSSVYYKVHKFGLNILEDENKIKEFEYLTNKNNKLVKEIAEADKIKGGNYNIIIDYALAKGLAHEAFGHAAETDSIENSILSKDGKFNKGLLVGNSYLNIIDESFDNEWAYAPFSDFGVIRKKVYIVKDGILNCGLSDVFSYKKANTDLTGAERSESYSNIPIPRMSNIRIELNNKYVNLDPPFNKEFEEISPEEVLKSCYEKKLFDNNKEIILLSGYKGGQVDTVKGNFVFNCQAIYKMDNGKVKIYKPSIFSGITLKTLNSISFGLGKLKLDAIGRCGKAGQSVNSSGGSHYYIGINYNKDIIIGGQ